MPEGGMRYRIMAPTTVKASTTIGGKPKPKPPIGLMPERIHNQNRALEICTAMARYISVSKPIPNHWFSELSRLCGEHQPPFTVEELNKEKNVNKTRQTA